MGESADYFLKSPLRAKPAIPIKAEPKRINISGSEKDGVVFGIMKNCSPVLFVKLSPMCKMVPSF